MKRVLITGAQGQDGKILSSIYLKKGFKVFGFIKKNKKNKIKKVKYLVNNLLSKKKILKHLKIIKPDIVLHLASLNNSYIKRINKDDYKYIYLQNLNISKNLVNSLISQKIRTKFIFAGSSLMFGNTKKKIVSEKNKLKTKEYYGKYKLDFYKFLEKTKKYNYFECSTVLLFNHDSAIRNKKFLIMKIIQAFKQKNINFIKKIYFENISGDFSHADDICEGIFKLSVYKKKIDKIILSSGKRFYLNQLIKYLEKRLNFKINNKKVSKNKANYKFIGSNKLAKKILNYKSRKNLINVCDDILNKT